MAVSRWFIVGSALAVLSISVLAHHGWSSFDQDKPLYVEGRVKSVQWANPHVELVLEVAAGSKAPADLAARKLPAQAQAVDGTALLKKTRAAPAGDWEIEFAPLSRMERWQVRPLKVGDRIEVIGYTGVPGKPRLMRAEFLFSDGKAYGLRSNPAN